VPASDSNRFVTEQDGGLGDQVDFSAATSPLPPARRDNPDISRYGYKGGLISPLVTLIVNTAGMNHNYEDDILPRLQSLYGRPVRHGDRWFNGTRIMTFVVSDPSVPGVFVG
jgi:hypothetical protein